MVMIAKSHTVAVALIALGSVAMAASSLPIDRTAAAQAIKDAAARNGDELPIALVRCGDDGDHCRFDAGEGVDLLVTTSGAAKVERLDVGWNNGRSSSSSRSAMRFESVCRAVVAAVRPQWDRAIVAREAKKLTLLRPNKKLRIEVEDRLADIVFFGSRDVPDSPEFPAEAFVQCGVMANAEN